MSDPMQDRDRERNDPAALRIGRLAARQEGVVKERQLREAGLDRFAASRWVRSGRLHRLYPGVYAVGHRAIGYTGRLIAALFYAGDGAALSHRTAAQWWWLIPRAPRDIHISVIRRTASVEGLVLHHPRRPERVFHRRLPVTPVPRTFVDLATDASVHELRKALAQADYRDLLALEKLGSVMGRGRPGSAKLSRAVEGHLPGLARTETPLEDQFMLVCERFGLPLPEPNVWIGSYRVDAIWRNERVIVELDSRSAHGSDARRMNDHERDLRLRGWGYAVRRYSWYQVYFKPETVAADAVRTLAARRSDAGS